MAGNDAKAKLQQLQAALKEMSNKRLFHFTLKECTKYGVQDRKGLWERLAPLAEELRDRKMLTDESNPTQSVHLRGALIKELQSEAMGFVYSRSPQTGNYGIDEVHKGENAKENTINAFTGIYNEPGPQTSEIFTSECEITFCTHLLELVYLEEQQNRCGVVEAATFINKDDVSYFGFCAQQPKDYRLFSLLIMPKSTAERYGDLITKDPTIIRDVYKTLFPKSHSQRRIEPSAEMIFIKDLDEDPQKRTTNSFMANYLDNLDYMTEKSEQNDGGMLAPRPQLIPRSKEKPTQQREERKRAIEEVPKSLNLNDQTEDFDEFFDWDESIVEDKGYSRLATGTLIAALISVSVACCSIVGYFIADRAQIFTSEQLNKIGEWPFIIGGTGLGSGLCLILLNIYFRLKSVVSDIDLEEW